jgi:hypothetical protein
LPTSQLLGYGGDIGFLLTTCLPNSGTYLEVNPLNLLVAAGMEAVDSGCPIHKDGTVPSIGSAGMKSGSWTSARAPIRVFPVNFSKDRLGNVVRTGGRFTGWSSNKSFVIHAVAFH